jgi:hypothetical protein
MSCANSNPAVCDLQMLSDITPATFTLARYQGESATDLEPIMIVRAMKRAEISVIPARSTDTSPDR